MYVEKVRKASLRGRVHGKGVKGEYTCRCIGTCTYIHIHLQGLVQGSFFNNLSGDAH